MRISSQIDRGTLVDVVYNNINDDIRKRYFHPGQKLVLRELSERYGISQTPIKQALNRLIADKVVENVPRYGVYVRRIRWEEVEEAMKARLMVEEYCIPFVLERAREPGFVDQIDRVFNAHAELRSREDYELIFPQHTRLDAQFHHLFVSCCRNSSIIGYYGELNSPIYLNYVYFGKKLQRLWDSFEEHKAIFSALLAGDKDALRAAILRHNRNITEDYRLILTQDREPAAVS